MTLITFGFGTPNRMLVNGLQNNEVLLYYNSEEVVDLPVSDDYKTAREQIFGKGGFLKDHIPVKSSELVTKKKRIKHYIKPEEVLIDAIDTVFPEKGKSYMRGVLKDASLCLITNAIQALSRDNEKECKEKIEDLNQTIYGYIQRTRKKDMNSYIEFNVEKINENQAKYSNSTSLLKTK